MFSVRLIDCIVTLLFRQQKFEVKKSKETHEAMLGDDSSEECIDDEDSDFDEEKDEA